jgi:hypothetical protein
MLAERKKEIDRKLAEEIFDYSGNVGRLKELKEGFRRAVEGVFMGEEGARDRRGKGGGVRSGAGVWERRVLCDDAGEEISNRGGVFMMATILCYF